MKSTIPSNRLTGDTVFVSYSHKNERWLNRVLVHLKPLQLGNQIDVWSDRRLKSGDEWKNEIDAALARASVAILLVSADFLASDFVSVVELPCLLQSAAKRNCKIVPVIVGPCAFPSIQNLQRFQAINPPDRPLEAMRKNQAEEILAKLASVVARHVADPTRRAQIQQPREQAEPPRLQETFTRDPKVDRFIAGVRLADWAAAEEAAIQIIAETDPSGHNEIFDALLNYQDAPSEHEMLWGALHTIECCVRLAPWLITHLQLSRMATHQNFSVRSAAAAICMDLAHSAPDRVPLDIAKKLSIYNEDWYVQTPANAALKAMARTTPEVLRLFHVRLRSSDLDESIHAAEEIKSVADQEPGLLDHDQLKRDLALLKRLGNTQAASHIRSAISKTAKVKRTQHYRYGL